MMLYWQPEKLLSMVACACTVAIFFSEDNTVSFRLCAPLDYLGRAFGLRNPLPAFAVKVFTV